MNYKHIPQDPKDNLLPGINIKTKARRKYERAMWPAMRQDQHTLLPAEKLAPPQEYCRVGDQVFNLSRMGKWNNKTIWSFYRAVHENNGVIGQPWLHDGVLQWQFVASDLWREMFSEKDNANPLSKRLETVKTRFVEWVDKLTLEQEASALKEIGQLDEERQWRMLRMLIEAKQLLKTQKGEHPKRPVSKDDPFWPAIRNQLKEAHNNVTDENADGENFYNYALKLLGPDGMRYYTHFVKGAYWR